MGEARTRTSYNRAAAVGDAIRERVHVGSLMLARQTTLVALAVGSDVLRMACPKFANGFLNLTDSPLLAHLLCGEVGVAAGTVPITLNGLGINAAHDAEVLAHTLHDVTSHPELVACIDAHARTDLVLPLAWHHFGVRAGNFDASE